MKSKQSIKILILLMSIALIGVIVIQFLWIKSAMQIKQEQFDRSVKTAMVRVSSDLESKYGVHWITEKLESDSSALKEVMSQDPGFYRFMISADDNHESGDSTGKESIEQTENVVTTTSYQTISTYDYDDPDNECLQNKVITIMRINRGKRPLIIDNSVWDKNSLAGAHRAVSKEKTHQTEIMPNAVIQTNAKQERIKLPKGSRLVSIVKSAADEWAMSKMNAKDVNSALDSNSILNAIKKEFKRQGLPDNFVFATYCTTGDTLIINKAASKNPLHDFAFHSPLMPTDFIEEGSLLLINFPAHYKYLFSSIAGMLALSLIFTISIISAFAYSLHVIFRQKKLSDITNDFINNMTHEFKTPLATISMTADTLALSMVSQNAEMVSNYSGMIKNEVKKLSRHVDRILETAIFEKNGAGKQSELFCLNQLLLDEIQIFEPAVAQRGGVLIADLPNHTISLFSSKDLMRCVISNLIDNAIKYSGNVPEIGVLVRKVGNKVLLRFTDKGIGIGKDDQGLIFEKFYRAPTGNRHDVKGFGLGLSFAKEVIENIGGKIWVESELGKGSSFFIEIPVSE